MPALEQLLRAMGDAYDRGRDDMHDETVEVVKRHLQGEAAKPILDDLAALAKVNAVHCRCDRGH